MVILCSFTKLYPLMKNTSILTKICMLLGEEMIMSSHPRLVKCVVIRIMFEIEETWAIVLCVRPTRTYTLQALILPCILFCVGLICVFIFLIVCYWALIIFKWFISYDDGFCFVKYFIIPRLIVPCIFTDAHIKFQWVLWGFSKTFCYLIVWIEVSGMFHTSEKEKKSPTCTSEFLTCRTSSTDWSNRSPHIMLNKWFSNFTLHMPRNYDQCMS